MLSRPGKGLIMYMSGFKREKNTKMPTKGRGMDEHSVRKRCLEIFELGGTSESKLS